MKSVKKFLRKAGLGALPILFFFIVLTVKAEKQPTYNIKLKEQILWQQLTPLGVLIVNTPLALYGINTDNGNVMWTLTELRGIPEESYQVLPNTFFAEVRLRNELIILDPYEGKLLFDSKKEGWNTIISTNLLYDAGGIVIYGIKNELKAYLSYVDIATGKSLWTNDNMFGKKSALGGLMALAANSTAGSGGDPQSLEIIETDKGTFVLALAAGLYKFDLKTGEKLWTADLPKPKGMVSASEEFKLIKAPSGDLFYYAKSNYVMGYRIDNGKAAWNEVVKINGIVDQIINHPKGLVVLPKADPLNTMTAPTVNLVNYETGEAYWGSKGKGIKIQGSVDSYFFVDSGLILSMKKGNDAFINILDINTGALKFPKSLKINGHLAYTELTPAGLLYITEPDPTSHGEINFFNLDTGKEVLAKSIKSGKSSDINDARLLTQHDGHLLYVFSNNDRVLYEIDKDKGMMKILHAGLQFQGKEKPSKIELRSEGILLSSEQNIALIGFEGKLAFHQYHAAPTDSGILRALYGMNSVVAALYSAQAHMASAAFAQAGSQTNDAATKQLAGDVSGAYGGMAQELGAYSKKSMQAARARYKASAESDDFVFMMITLDKQKAGVGKVLEGKKYGLAQIDKRTGEIQDVIYMNNEKEPSYQVDMITNSIYYRIDNNQIICYQF